MAYIEKVTDMRRFVVYYTKSGHIYMEGLVLRNCAIVHCVDDDLPNIMYFQEGGGDTGLSNFKCFLDRLPESHDLTIAILDSNSRHYDPRRKLNVPNILLTDNDAEKQEQPYGS